MLDGLMAPIPPQEIIQLRIEAKGRCRHA
jgi:hypothetical protein